MLEILDLTLALLCAGLGAIRTKVPALARIEPIAALDTSNRHAILHPGWADAAQERLSPLLVVREQPQEAGEESWEGHYQGAPHQDSGAIVQVVDQRPGQNLLG